VRAVKGRLRNLEEPKVAELFRMAGDFVPPTFEGETIIGVGRTLDFYRRGAAGAIHVVPFGCIVGTIVETLSERLSRVLGGFPILTLKFDGRENRLPASRLEGFLMQARLWKEKGGDHEDPGDRESAGRRREGRPTSPTDSGLAAG
jgi:predicted nucleotide-binding protein (sugar kinase/HSP70/actin superfamily)